jgi:hypothetical protein
MMETDRAVSGVVSAFHGGADLVKQIRKRSKKKKGEQALKEKLLQEALESGESQISKLYTQHHNELGASFKTGDGKHNSDVNCERYLLILNRYIPNQAIDHCS